MKLLATDEASATIPTRRSPSRCPSLRQALRDTDALGLKGDNSLDVTVDAAPSNTLHEDRIISDRDYVSHQWS